MNNQLYLPLGTEAANLHQVESLHDSDDEKGVGGRRRRQLVPGEQKDDAYWQKRKKNNEAARRSREKRRANDMMLERRLTELQKENQGLKAQLYALQLRYGEIGYGQAAQMGQPAGYHMVATSHQEHLAHQHAHTQAMAAAASAAAAALQIKKEHSAGNFPSLGPAEKKAKIVPEVTLPDGRKLLLDHEDQKNSIQIKQEAPALAELPARMASPSPSETSSADVVVDDEIDVVTTAPVGLKCSGSSGVSSDNETSSNNSSKASHSKKKVQKRPESDAAALAAAEEAARASRHILNRAAPPTAAQQLQVHGRAAVPQIAVPQIQMGDKGAGQRTERGREVLTEYYKQQLSAIYAQRQGQQAGGGQAGMMGLGGTSAAAATQMAISLLNQGGGVQKM